MATYDVELLEAARLLLFRPHGMRGRLPRARVRRSISTSYYALFHFILEETSGLVAGSDNRLRTRRRVLSRVVTHAGLKAALNRVRGAQIEPAFNMFFVSAAADAGPLAVPRFARSLAAAFIDSQAKRHEADYDLNTKLSERDARLLVNRVEQATARWRAANSKIDRDFKHALSLLIVLKGQLRTDA